MDPFMIFDLNGNDQLDPFEAGMAYGFMTEQERSAKSQRSCLWDDDDDDDDEEGGYISSGLYPGMFF